MRPLLHVETLCHARAKSFEAHRTWALRLYVLALGSWLYRMEHGFWFLFTEGVSSTPDLTGAFDQVIAFFFYMPNLIILELFFRTRTVAISTAAKAFASMVLFLVSGMLLLLTLGFALDAWGPSIWGLALA